MVNITAALANVTRPGVSISETTAGFRVLEIASHSAIYMIGSGTAGDFLEPTIVNSLTDFANQFGGSPSENSVKLLFRNDPQAVLYFIRAATATQFTVTVDTASPGAYTLTINGEDVTYTAVGGDTEADVAAGLIDAINVAPIAATVSAQAGATTDELIIRPDDYAAALTVIVDTGSMTAVDTTPLTPNAADYVQAIENTFEYEEDWAQGFLLAPEAFQRLTDASDRLAVGAAMEALASDENYDWVALVDVGANLSTVAEVRTDGEQYTTAQGHTAFYAPYVIDLEANIVPASAAIAGIATRRYREQGFQQPPAGALYPLRGVTNVQTRFGGQDQSVLNPLGINLVRFLRNKGVVAWGARTRSTDDFYRFVNTRVVMNVLNGTLRSGFDFEIFTAIDGQGVLLERIEETARSVCYQLWIAGALFGEDSTDAYEVRCDFTNNTPQSLEQGAAILEVYVAPAPTLEKLLVNTIRVAIGNVQDAAAAGQLPS